MRASLFRAFAGRLRPRGFNGKFADGHQFVEDAFARGAVAAVVRADRVNGDPKLTALQDRLLLVPDAIAALQMLAHRVYESWGNRWLELRAVREKQPPRSWRRICLVRAVAPY